MNLKEFIGVEGKDKIVAAIKEAELNTSGEIRVHLESKVKGGDAVERAVAIFNYLKMYKTKERNGVLIYVATESKKFAIIGDEGINKSVPENFWAEISANMGKSFAKGEFVKGLVDAIIKSGKELKRYFPYTEGDINEQPDDISFGE